MYQVLSESSEFCRRYYKKHFGLFFPQTLCINKVIITLLHVVRKQLVIPSFTLPCFTDDAWFYFTLVCGKTRLQTPVPSYSHTEHRMPTTTTTAPLFDDKTKDAVLDCITGEVVGIRPRHIDTVDVRQLRHSEHNEPDHHRRAAFHDIFDNRRWGTNPNVSFSASGRGIQRMGQKPYCFQILFNSFILLS